MQLSCRFDLDYQHIVDNQVEPLRAERLTFVHDLDVDLTRDTMPSLEELALERYDIQMLEEAESKLIVHLIKGPDDGVWELFLEELNAAHERTSRHASHRA